MELRSLTLCSADFRAERVTGMARGSNSDGLAAVTLLVASSLVATATLSTADLLVQGFGKGEWDYSRQLVTTLPYALIWGFVGGGVAFIVSRRALRPRQTGSWVGLAAVAGLASGTLTAGVLGTPAGGGWLEGLGVLLAGASWGAAQGWLTWHLTKPTTSGTPS
jgi:hypothetical protein